MGAYIDINSSEEIWDFFKQYMEFETIGDVNFDFFINVQHLLYMVDYINSGNQFYFYMI